VNARQVLAWVKANVFIVVFSVVMIAALVALPIVSGRMNSSVQDRVQERVTKTREIERFENTNVSLQLPDGTEESWTTVVNEDLIDQYRAYVEAEREDADQIVAEAVAFNSKGRSTVMPELFPTPRGQIEVLPLRYWERLTAAYDELLERVNAGMPPTGSDPVERLERQRRSYIADRIQKTEGDALTDKETEELREYLAGIRLGIYSDAADRIGFYLDRAQLPIPAWNQNVLYHENLDLLFSWQWDYWVVEDVLEAIADANAGAGSVRVAPVKRVVSIGLGPAAGGNESGGGMTGGPPGFGAGGRGEPAGPAAPPSNAPDASRELAPDWSVSLTGRTSNDLYDIRMVELTVVAETARLPQLFDALARRNFITVVDADVLPADSYQAVAAGFYYGSEPVSEVRLLLETIWLRAWTREFMPDVTRGLMGVYRPEPAPAGGASG
jgi:hypothetical protein